MRLTSSLLREILNKNDTICCLCLSSTEYDAFNVYDEICLDNSENVQVFAIIRSVFAYSLLDIECVSHMVCKECTKTLISTFKFIEQCIKIRKYLNMVLHNLTKCLKDDKIDTQSKGMCVAIDPESCYSKIYYSFKKPACSAPAIVKVLKTILQEEHHDQEEVEKLPSFSNYLKVKCSLCDVVCNNKNSLKEHSLLNCNGKVKCEDDNETYEDNAMYSDDQSDTKLNKKKKSYLPEVSCEFCGKTCKNKYTLRYHMLKSCKNLKEHYPTFDESSLKTLVDLKLKLQFKSKSNPHKSSLCVDCGKVVANLPEHELSHIKSFVCVKCAKNFKTEKSYLKHTALPNCKEKPDEFLPPPKNYSCDKCGAQYSTKGVLQIHMKARHSDTGFECNLCKKKLSSKAALNLHMVTHTQKKNFECNVCGGRFVSKHSLLYHTRTHTGEKPYKCKFCDSRFLSASRRNIHTRIHHLPPQLACTICFKKFTNWGALNRHRKRHYNPSSSLFMKDLNTEVTTD